MMNRIPCTTHDSPVVIKFPFNELKCGLNNYLKFVISVF